MPGAKKNFIGLEGFIWWIGVVEDRQDPEQLGRVRVRCFGFHTENKNKIPTDSLPWAHPMIPVNNPNAYTPKEGDMVMGFFMDGENAQNPVIMGVLPGKPEKKPEYEQGFSDPAKDLSGRPNKIGDASEAYPKGKYIKESTTNRLSRGKSDSTVIATRTRNLIKDIKSAGGVSWSEPNPAFNPTYPYNNALESESGHALEFDDTPGQERVHMAHRMGSFFEIDREGSKVEKVVKDNYELVMGSDYVYIKGNCAVTIGGDCNLKVVGTINVEADEINMAATGDIKLKAGKAVKVQSGTTTDMSAGKEFNLRSGKTFNIKSDSSVAIEGTSTVSVKSTSSVAIEGVAGASVKSSSGVNIQGGTSVGISSGGATAIQAGGGLSLSGSGSVGLSGSSVEVAAPLNVMGPTNLTVTGVTMVASGPGPHIHAIVAQPVSGSGASAGGGGAGSAASAASAEDASDSGLSDPSTGSVASEPSSTTTSTPTTTTSTEGSVVGKTVDGVTSTVSNVYSGLSSAADILTQELASNLPIGELTNKVQNFEYDVNSNRGLILSLIDDLQGPLLTKIDGIIKATDALNIDLNIDLDILNRVEEVVNPVNQYTTIIGKHIYPKTESISILSTVLGANSA